MDSVINQFKQAADKTVNHLKSEYSKLQTGSASSALVEGIMVTAYGNTQPLKNVAGISIPESRVIRIQPWDKGVLKDIEAAVVKADLGINPVNNGEALILNIPMLTEERRRDLVKVVKKLAEEAKVTIRQARQDAHNQLKRMKEASEITEDDHRGAEKRLQDAVDKVNNEIDEVAEHKEKAVMTV